MKKVKKSKIKNGGLLSTFWHFSLGCFFQKIQVSRGFGCNAKIFKKHFSELSYNLVFKNMHSTSELFIFFRKQFRATVWCDIKYPKSKSSTFIHCFHIFRKKINKIETSLICISEVLTAREEKSLSWCKEGSKNCPFHQ